MTLKTPLRYPGGKSKTYPYIKELVRLNNCDTYIEPYAGGSGVAISLLLNHDVNKIILNDYDKSIYAFWFSVIHYHEELIEMIKSTDITISEWCKQKEIQSSKEKNDNLLQLGFSTLFLNRTNRSGILKAGVIGGKNQSGTYKLDCRFNKKDICNRILDIAKVSSKIELYNYDAEYFIKNYVLNSFDSLTFLDPPYYAKGPGLYTNFYSHEDHENLAKLINENMKDKKWILTYDNSDEIYVMYKDYYHIQYYLNYSIGTPSKGIEYMFFSPTLKIGALENHLKVL